MNEGDKSDRGVIVAATLLQLSAVPFIFLTSILFVVVLIIPFGLVTPSEIDDTTFGYRILVYAAFLLAMIIGFIVTSGMMMMVSMMKANHLVNQHRQSPKARLYAFTDNLLILIALELVLGSILGVFSCYTQGAIKAEGFQMGKAILFLSVLFMSGVVVFFFRRYFLRISWWRAANEQ